MPAILRPCSVLRMRRRPGSAREPKPALPSVENALALWRTKEPTRITTADTARLAGQIAATEILGDRRWHAARDGDGAAAVAVAIDHLHRRVAMVPLTDVVVGNLLPLALGGDPTAALVIGHALRALARLDPSNAELPRLAGLWDPRRIHGDSKRRRGRTGRSTRPLVPSIPGVCA